MVRLAPLRGVVFCCFWPHVGRKGGKRSPASDWRGRRFEAVCHTPDVFPHMSHLPCVPPQMSHFPLVSPHVTSHLCSPQMSHSPICVPHMSHVFPTCHILPFVFSHTPHSPICVSPHAVLLQPQTGERSQVREKLSACVTWRALLVHPLIRLSHQTL